MRKLFYFYPLIIVLLVACQKEDITPTPDPIINNPNLTDTTHTIGDTTTTIDSTLHFQFAVTTDVAREKLDSVVIIHYVNEIPMDSVTLLRTDIDGMDVNSGYIIYSSTMVHKPNSIELNGSGDSFYIFHYLNTPMIYTMSQERFEFGTTNMQTASNFLQYNIVNGKYVLSGYQVY